jgi:NitT/TauT family transport system substrate-binding protein
MLPIAVTSSAIHALAHLSDAGKSPQLSKLAGLHGPCFPTRLSAGAQQERPMTSTSFVRILFSASLALASAGAAATAVAQSRDKVALGHQAPPTFETIYRNLALDGGFFTKQGIDAKITGFTAGLTTVQAVASGSIDFGCESILSVLTAMRQGADFRILEMINADNSYVVVAHDKAATPADLRKKRWGISQAGNISQTFSMLWLNHYGVSDVEWIPVGGQSARGRALVAGQIDATLMTFGDWTRIQKQPGIKMMGSIADVLPPVPFSSCFATRQTVQDKPDLAQRVINALMDAARYARTPEGKRAFLESYKKENEGNHSDQQLNQFYAYFFEQNPILVDPNGGMYPDVLYKNLQMMVADKTLPAMLPLDKVWEPKFVAQYLGVNGWYDTKAKTGGHYLRDLLNRK